MTALRMWLDVTFPLWRIALAFAVVAAFAAAVWWIRDTGVQAERAEWVAKMATAKAEWQLELNKANAATRATERQSAQVIADVSFYYQKGLKNDQLQKDADRAAVRGGGIRLWFDPVRPASNSIGGELPSTGAFGTGTSGRDGATRGELPQSIAGDLLDLANDANAVVRQLTAAQAVIKEYQRVCGAGANGSGGP